MRTRTIWEANDGSRWDSAPECRKRDELIAEVEEAMRPLGKRYDDGHCNFSNGHGYVQHKHSAVALARENLLVPTRRLLASWFADQIKDHGKDPSDAHPSWFCRMLDGTAGPLESAWSRIACIDVKSREWGQQYFASHPGEARDQTEIKVASAASDRREGD